MNIESLSNDQLLELETYVKSGEFGSDLSTMTADKLVAKQMPASLGVLLHSTDLSMTANGITYRKDLRGFIPKLMDKIYAERSVAKKKMIAAEQLLENINNEISKSTTEELIKLREKTSNEISYYKNIQLAKKTQINSVYGSMGSPYFRYYDLRMAEGITTSGQLAIRWVSQDVNKSLNKVLGTNNVDYVIYNDTDSAYFVLEEVVNRSKYKDASKEEIVKFLDKFCEEVLQKLINKSYENLKDYVNAYEQRLIMKREVIADVSVFVAKKRYALSVYNSEGVQYKEPKIKVTGLELVRSSTPRVVRDVLKKGVKEVLYKDEAAVQEFIANFKSTYMTYSVEEIAFPRGVNGVSKYSSNGPTVYKQKTPIHVRAALLFNSQVEKYKLTHLHQPIKDGNKIKFVYLKLPNTLHEDVIGFVDTLPKEFKLDTYVDKERMFETSFVNAMKSLMDPLGWSTEPKVSLDSFFF